MVEHYPLHQGSKMLWLATQTFSYICQRLEQDILRSLVHILACEGQRIHQATLVQIEHFTEKFVEEDGMACFVNLLCSQKDTHLFVRSGSDICAQRIGYAHLTLEK